MICNWFVAKSLPAIFCALSLTFSTLAYAEGKDPAADNLTPASQAAEKTVPKESTGEDKSAEEDQNKYGKLNIEGVADNLAWSGQSYPGIRITKVLDAGIGAQAHLVAGDILLTVNGFSITDDKEGEKILQAQPDGQLEVSFARSTNGQWQILSAAVEHRKLAAPESSTLYVIKSSGESRQSMAERMLELVNRDRLQNEEEELPPLLLNTSLSELAQSLADDMVARHYFGHINPEGLGPQERAKKANLPVPAAETILSGAISLNEAESSFMEEPANDPANNRGRILNRHFKEVGIGVARQPDATLVLVLEFLSGSKKGRKN